MATLQTARIELTTRKPRRFPIFHEALRLLGDFAMTRQHAMMKLADPWPPGDRHWITPDDTRAARLAREAARQAAEAAATRTRRVVFAIWAVACGLGIGLAVAAISS